MSRVLASILCGLTLNASAQSWVGWHPNAWTNYRSTVETVGVYATSHSYVLTNYAGTNASVITNAFLSNIYAASNASAIVSTFTFTLTASNGVAWTNSITTTNRHAATNLVLANREIACFDLYAAMRERDSALCDSASQKESVRFYRYERDNLVYAKQWLTNRIGNFVSTNQPADGFAGLNVPALLLTYGLPSNYLAQTPYRALWCGDTGGRMIETSRWTLATSTNIVTNVLTTTCGNVITNIGTGGVVTAVCTNAVPYEGINTNGSTWGFCAIRDIFNALQWTAEQGAPTDCGGESNRVASTSGTFCNVDTLESNYTFTASASGFPLYESRHFNPGTNVTYQGYTVREHWLVDAPFVPQNCPTNYPPPSPWIYFSFTDITNAWSSCAQPPADAWVCLEPTNLLEASYDYYVVTNAITNHCDAAYACGIGSSCLSSHLAPITFDNCTNRYGTNVTFTGVIYYNVGATGTCAGASATLTDPFGYGLGAGWTNPIVYAQDLFTNTTICTTNFSPTNRIPWQGSTSTNATAWVIYDAKLVKKWNFAYKP